MSVRQMIGEVQAEVLAGDLTPIRAAELDMRLTALLGNCFEEIRESEAAYNQVYLGCLNSCEAANRAKIHAAITPEFKRWREAKDTHEFALQMIRSTRSYTRASAEEARLQR